MKLYLQIRGARGKAPDNTVLVQSLGSGAAYQVEVSVEGVVVQATIDTAAEATIIS